MQWFPTEVKPHPGVPIAMLKDVQRSSKIKMISR